MNGDDLERRLKEAEAGDAAAMVCLGDGYRDRGNQSDFDEIDEESRAAIPEYHEARRWYGRAAEAGDTGAMRSLARMHLEGEGGGRSDEEAVRWYRRAAEAGDDWGMHSLADMLYAGRGVPEDHTAAADWYRRAALAGNDWAMTALGSMHLVGHGVPRDADEARRLFERSASAGNTFAMLDLGDLYRDGDGVEGDFEAAAGWYRRALALGNEVAAEALERLNDPGLGPSPEQQGPEALGRAAEDGNPAAMRALAERYARGDGLPQDHGQALAWYRRAAEEHNDAEAMLEVANLYDRGLGVPESAAEAVRWDRRAARLGNATACAAIGNRYAGGEGVAPDPRLAAAYLALATAREDDPDMRDIWSRRRDELMGTLSSADVALVGALIERCVSVGPAALPDEI